VTEEDRVGRKSAVQEIEDQLLEDIAAKAREHSSNGGQELVAPDPKFEARMATVSAGIAEVQAIYAERDQWRERAAAAEVRVTEMLNLVDQAREGERVRLKEVSDKAITEARAALAAQEVLQGEVDSMRSRLAAADAKIQEAQAEAAKYKTFALLVRASVDKLIPKD